MQEQERKRKLEEILGNEQLMKQISNTETKDEMQQLFADNGLPLSNEEIDGFINIMNTISSSEELNSDELAQVSGGVDPFTIFSLSWGIISKIAKPCWRAGVWFAKKFG